VIVFVWLVLPGLCNAYVVGGGAAELSVSAEKESHVFGVAGSYQLNSAAPRFITLFTSQFQLGTNLGRSSQEVVETDYLYEQSYIETSGEIDYLFSEASIRWHSGYTSQTDFLQGEKLDSEMVSSVDESDTSWTVTTGPMLTINQGGGYLIETSVNLSYMDSKEEFATEKNSIISFKKSISPITRFGLGGSWVCTEYDVVSGNDSCRFEYDFTIERERKNLDIKVGLGRSEEGGTSTDTYLGLINYRMNSYSNISISSEKSINTILNKSNSMLDDKDYTLSAQTSTRLIEYRYGVGGRDLSVAFMEQDLIAGLIVTRSMSGSVSLNHRLYSTLCVFCVMSLNYDYSNFDSERSKKVSSISIVKRNSRDFSTSINVIQTKVDSELAVWSMGLLFTYNGRQTRLGER